MTVLTLTTAEALAPYQTRWTAVYRADPLAHLFLSWAWGQSFRQATPHAWQVLVYEEQGEALAFLPLVRQKTSKGLVTILHLGGWPWADYSGFLCWPGAEARALPAFAEAIQQMAWDQFELLDVVDERLPLFVSAFDPQAYEVVNGRSLSCPYLTLPEDWDTYLQSLSKSTREHLRRRLRQVESLPGYRVSHASRENLDGQLDALLPLWEGRWNAHGAGAGYRPLLAACWQNGCLWCEVLWDGERPLAGLVAFTDPDKQTFAYFISGYNPELDHLSPGRVMVAHSLRHALAHNYRTYDFLRGGEAYKFSFGAQDRHSQAVAITRRSLKNKLLAWRKSH